MRQAGESASEHDILRRRELEERFWRTSEQERPGSESLGNVVNKMQDAEILLSLVERYRPLFARADTVLELGAGQGWGACLVKRLFPAAVVTASDLSEAAIASAEMWERLFEVELDRKRYYPSDEIDEPDASFDLVFCFAAAHHFGRHRRGLEELHRVLRPGGFGLYLYEPTCPAYLYGLARWRVTRKRPEVPEDVLVSGRLRALAEDVGLEVHVDFWPDLTRREPLATVYYALLGKLRPLQRALPCTANFRFRKPD